MAVGLIMALLFAVAAAKKPGDYRTSYACEGLQLNISCGEGNLIRLIRANYGRFSISICNEHGNLDWSVDCTSLRSYYVIRDRCDMMSSCSVKATSDIFGDRCPGTYKYLEVQYQCILESMTTTSNSSVMRKPFISPTTTTTTTTTTTSTMRPPIIIPISRSTKPTISTTPFKAATTTKMMSSTTTTATPFTRHATVMSTTVIPPTAVSRTSIADEWKTTASVPIVAYNTENYCVPTHSRNLTWEWTKAGTEVVQRCPDGTFGEARWHCDIDPVRWVPDVPDMSECSSLWVDNLRSRVDSGDSVVNIAAELSVMTDRKPLYGGDVKYATQILHRLISKMSDKMKEIADDKQRHQLLQELLESAGDVTSNLLEVSASWGELSAVERRHLATTLLEALENSGWLLASAHKSAFLFRKALHNIFLSVQVLEAWSVSDITFPSSEEIRGTVWDTFEDRIHLPMQALLGHAADGVVKVFFASYERVKDFLGADASNHQGILQNSSWIINSRVISAYTGRYPNFKFSEPVTITFKLLQEENVTNPQCVFWDIESRLWSQEGCWLKNSNKTHAICECDHLTSFALLMEMRPDVVKHENTLLSKVVIYTTSILASILFLMTLILLQVFRSFPDDNSTIRKHLCFCLIMSEVIYLCSIGTANLPCAILAGALHFFLQAVFVWFFLSGFELYLLLVEPNHNSRIHLYSVVAYGVPAVILTVSALVDPKSYGACDYCFLQFNNYYIFSFIGPAITCILGAFLFLVLSIWKICSSSSSTKTQDTAKFNTASLRCRDAWFVILSTTSCWAFLLSFMHLKVIGLAYVFSALNCVQGLAVFVFYGLNSSEVQQAYNKWKAEGSCVQPKNTARQFPLPTVMSQHVEASYLQPSTTVSSLSTVTTPEMEFQLGTFHHSDLCHATRSPIYDNREQLVA